MHEKPPLAGVPLDARHPGQAGSAGGEAASSADPTATLFGRLDDAALSPPMRNLLNALLLYKSMFAGPWFTALSVAEDPGTQAVYELIRVETASQARRTAETLRRWGALPPHEGAEDATREVLKRLLEDMLALKKSSTEVFLGAGLSAPTEEMRREFLDLADMDRRHADLLRRMLHVHPPHETDLDAPWAAPVFDGVQTGPFGPGRLSGKLWDTLEAARGQGHEPSRIVLSGMALRHLRDEGTVAPRQGEIFGLPVDIDFSWRGECFAVTSRERLSLAEIVTEMVTSGGAGGPAG
jgi:hypothetical protein